MRISPEHEQVSIKKWQQFSFFQWYFSVGGMENDRPEKICVLATITFPLIGGAPTISDLPSSSCVKSPFRDFCFFFQVDSKDSSRNSMNSEFAAEAESQNDKIEDPDKVQKRKRDRLRDQGSTMIYLKAIQGILGKSMPKKKGEATTRAKPNTGERASRGEVPARSVSVSAPPKEKGSAPEVGVKGEKAVLEKSGLCDRRVAVDPPEKPSMEPCVDRRTVIDKCPLPLEFLDDSDSHLESQKVS